MTEEGVAGGKEGYRKGEGSLGGASRIPHRVAPTPLPGALRGPKKAQDGLEMASRWPQRAPR